MSSVSRFALSVFDSLDAQNQLAPSSLNNSFPASSRRRHHSHQRKFRNRHDDGKLSGQLPQISEIRTSRAQEQQLDASLSGKEGVRFGVTTSTKTSSIASDPVQLVSIVFYGLQNSVQSCHNRDRLLRLSVGSVKLFGLDGMELMSCGGDPDAWLMYNFTSDSEGAVGGGGGGGGAASALQHDTSSGEELRRALMLSLQWCQRVSVAATATVGSSKIESFSTDRNARSRRRRHEYESHEGDTDISQDDSSHDSDEDGSSECGSSDGAGDDTEDDMHSALDIDEMKNRRSRLAIGGDAANSLYGAETKAETHLVGEIVLGAVQFNWSSRSLNCIADLYRVVVPTVSMMNQDKPFRDLKHSAAMLSCREGWTAKQQSDVSQSAQKVSYFIKDEWMWAVPSKISLDFCAMGISISIPIIASCDSAAVLNSGTSPRGIENVTVSPKSQHSTHKTQTTTNCLVLSISRISFYSGDYVDSLLASQLAVAAAAAAANTPQKSNEEAHLASSDSSAGSDSPTSPQHAGKEDLLDLNSDDTLELSASDEQHLPLGNNRRRGGSSPDNSGTARVSDSKLEEVTKVVSIDDKIRDLVTQLRSPLINPMVFHILNVALSFQSTIVDGEQETVGSGGLLLAEELSKSKTAQIVKRAITIHEWSLSGVLSICSARPHASYVDTRLNLFNTPFKIMLSTSVSNSIGSEKEQNNYDCDGNSWPFSV